MRASIILIGPGKAGKTTLLPLLGESLGWPFIDLDDLRWGYYAEIGYDATIAKIIRQQGGLKAIAAYWKPFEIYAVESVLRDYPSNHVIAFGAGHSIYDDEALFLRAKEALAPFPHVILLLPSPDPAESTLILRQRLRADEPDLTEASIDGIMEVNSSFVNHPSNLRLATMTIYTAGRTAANTCQEIMSRCSKLSA